MWSSSRSWNELTFDQRLLSFVSFHCWRIFHRFCFLTSVKVMTRTRCSPNILSSPNLMIVTWFAGWFIYSWHSNPRNLCLNFSRKSAVEWRRLIIAREMVFSTRKQKHKQPPFHTNVKHILSALSSAKREGKQQQQQQQLVWIWLFLMLKFDLGSKEGMYPTRNKENKRETQKEEAEPPLTLPLPLSPPPSSYLYSSPYKHFSPYLYFTLLYFYFDFSLYFTFFLLFYFTLPFLIWFQGKKGEGEKGTS